MLASPYTRGAVSGLGFITVLAGLAELASAFSARRRASTVPPAPGVTSDR
ncbi:MAG: hypothetical protein H0U94_12780 [Acidobacteria bacterium]|nr:hypothetical protein [Acidobacteriota bacterium]